MSNFELIRSIARIQAVADLWRWRPDIARANLRRQTQDEIDTQKDYDEEREFGGHG